MILSMFTVAKAIL